MRIIWNADRGQAVANSLANMYEQLEALEDQVGLARAALQEADPDGSDKRLKGIAQRFERNVERLEKLRRDTEDTLGATQRMIALMNGAENEAVRMLNELATGSRTMDEGAPAHSPVVYVRPEPAPPRRLPFRLPPVRIAPRTRLDPFGPAMGWLMELIDRL